MYVGVHAHTSIQPLLPCGIDQSGKLILLDQFR